MGPIVLFDKSFVEMLNIDEAALFDFLYLTNICPKDESGGCAC